MRKRSSERESPSYTYMGGAYDLFVLTSSAKLVKCTCKVYGICFIDIAWSPFFCFCCVVLMFSSSFLCLYHRSVFVFLFLWLIFRKKKHISFFPYFIVLIVWIFHTGPFFFYHILSKGNKEIMNLF